MVMTAALRAPLVGDAFAELTMMVVVGDERSCFDSALGVRSPGFTDRCGLAP
jgi:hypothetical protein